MVAFPQKVLASVPLLNTLFQQHAPALYDSSNFLAVARFNSEIKGLVAFTPNLSGAVNVKVELSGLPDEGGPFMYHIHEFAVPNNGDCYATGLHLNPFQGVTPCASALDNSLCEVGDLSGKHGAIYGNQWSASYTDEYLSLNVDNLAFIGGLSITIHLADNTRIACSNIVLEGYPQQGRLFKEVNTLKNSSNSSNSSTSTSIGLAPVNGLPYGLVAAGIAGLAAVLL